MKESIIIRKAENNDKNELERLFLECFGQLAIKEGALKYIENRYTVAETNHGNKKKIVAVSGIIPIEKSSFQGYEITWTCTSKDYRERGLIVKIIEECESKLIDDHIPLYCDCWRIKDNDRINMFYVMQKLGMHEVINSRIKRKKTHCKSCEKCIYDSEGCFCYGDLYMKER